MYRLRRLQLSYVTACGTILDTLSWYPHKLPPGPLCQLTCVRRFSVKHSVPNLSLLRGLTRIQQKLYLCKFGFQQTQRPLLEFVKRAYVLQDADCSPQNNTSACTKAWGQGMIQQVCSCGAHFLLVAAELSAKVTDGHHCIANCQLAVLTPSVLAV